jgi:ABC-type nitrate/sulfonate/bicarbonate transport system substrate-binding protein
MARVRLIFLPRVFLPLLAVAVLAAGCGSSGGDAASSSSGTGGSPKQAQTVRIALDYTANVNYVGIYAAIKNGYFAKQGITPKIIPYAQVPAETLVKANKTDLGISVPSEVITQRAAGLKYKAVAALVASNTTALAVKAGGPYTRPAQLNGKTYGGFGIASDEPIIKEILRRDGVKDPSFKQVTLNTDAYVALGKGRIDYSAVFGGIDDVTAAAQGTKLRLFPYAKYLGAAGQFPNAVYVASDATIARKGDALKRTACSARPRL